MLSKKDRILEAAEKIVAKKGLDGLSIQQIAEEANISIGGFYLHFESKEHLICSLKEAVIFNLSKALLNGFNEQYSPWENYRIIWFNIVTFGKDRDDNRISFEQYLRFPGVVGENVSQSEKSLFLPLFNIYKKAISEREILDIDVNYLIALSLESATALSRYIRRGAIAYDPIELDEVCKLSWDSIRVRVLS